MLGNKIRQNIHLFRVERANNQVAPCSSRILQYLIDITVLSSVPSMHIDGEALFLQTVAGHQHPSIVFHHTSPVAIDIMQRKHHSQSYLTVTYIVSLGGSLLCGFTSLCCTLSLLCFLNRLRIRDIQNHSFLKFIAWLLHLRIRINQLFDGEPVIP